MTYGTYAVHLPPHPTRIGNVRSLAGIRGIAVHTSEGGELTTSAEALSGFISSPRTYFPDGRIQNTASYHAISDTDRILIEVAENRVAYAAGGGNSDFLHICIPGRVSQTREQWLDANSRAHIRRVAEYICDKAPVYNIPLTKLTIAQVKAGARGYCGHNDISKAFNKSTHTDPEPKFPWDVLASDIAELTYVAPEPTPPPAPILFDPNRGLYGLYPLNPDKRSIGAFSTGDDVRYAKGVLRDHVSRFCRWFAAHPAYESYWNDSLTWVNPASGKIHQNVRRQDMWNLTTAICERVDPNWDAFDGTMFDAVVGTQVTFNGLNIEGRQLGPMAVDGIIGPKQMWPFLDSLADGNW